MTPFGGQLHTSFAIPTTRRIPITGSTSALAAISAGSKTNVWGVNSAGNIFTFTSDDSTPWVQIAGGLVDIGAGNDGVVWGVNSAGNI
jgi:hypothetical protein